MPITENETNESEKLVFVEEEIDIMDESPVSFRLSRPNEELSRNGNPDEEPASNETEQMVYAQGEGEDEDDGVTKFPLCVLLGWDHGGLGLGSTKG